MAPYNWRLFRSRKKFVDSVNDGLTRVSNIKSCQKWGFCYKPTLHKGFDCQCIVFLNMKLTGRKG